MTLNLILDLSAPSPHCYCYPPLLRCDTFLVTIYILIEPIIKLDLYRKHDTHLKFILWLFFRMRQS